MRMKGQRPHWLEEIVAGIGRKVGGLGLAPRLFLATSLSIVAGAGTLLAIALLVAPALFYNHLEQAHLTTVTAEVRSHVDTAFTTALVVSLAIAVLVATLIAVTVTWLVACRLASSVQQVVAATQRLSEGHYDVAVPDPRLGPEFATLSSSVTRLSRRLADADATRRRLMTDLAHQLRTPLASLEATVEAIDDDVLPPDTATLTVLTDQTGRLHRLVADLETISRAEERHVSLDARPQALAPLLASGMDAVRDRYRAKDVSLRLDADPGCAPVRIDAERLAEAVGNLLDNALRHTPPGGTVTVTLRCPDAPNGRVRVTVQDTGTGFRPEDAEQLFTRFHRGEGADHIIGSGLGLTIARALIDAHEGTLTAHSDGPGRGATFTIELHTLPTVAHPRTLGGGRTLTPRCSSTRSDHQLCQALQRLPG